MSSAKRGCSDGLVEESHNGRSEFPYLAGNNHFDSPHEEDCPNCGGTGKEPSRIDGKACYMCQGTKKIIQKH